MGGPTPVVDARALGYAQIAGPIGLTPVAAHSRRRQGGVLVEISAIMTTNLATVGPEYNVADVASVMDARGIGSVIVLEDDRVLGILTERDILRVIGGGEDPKNVAAHEALTDDLITIRPDASVDEAAREMVNAKVRHLPVISDEGLIGMVSMRDLVRWSLRDMSEAVTELPHIQLSREVLSLVHPVEERQDTERA
jgi:CBS domain-containing protein